MSQPKTIYLHDYQAPSFRIHSIDLSFDLYETHTLVSNSMQIEKSHVHDEALVLDSIDLELLHLTLDGVELETSRYAYAENRLSISALPQTFTLQITNKIYPQNNSELEGLYKSGGIFCTQNEPEGFRRITPYLDRPDVLSLFRTTITADQKAYPVLLGNGNPQPEASEILDQGRHRVTWYDPHPKPAYLFALVAGDLGSITDSFTTASGQPVALAIYCDPGNESKCHHAMRSLKEAMLWDEQKYGCEYDLEVYNIVAVASFNMGAMENKGLNIFNDQAVLADADVATDANFMRIQSIVAHEYFHNWTGNRITCKNWFQLTLKEGLTVFRDQCFSADLNDEAVQRIDDVEALRNFQFVEDASPTAHPIQPKSYISMNNFYTSTVYNKGAEVIRMIHTLIGEENYRKAMDLYFETFDGQAVTTQDFLWAMQEASGHDLTQFGRWYDQSGTPRLKVTEAYEAGRYTLTLRQQIPMTLEGEAQKPYYFPLKIALIDTEGKSVVEQTLILSKEEERFTFDGLSSAPYLSVNRDFSAPILIEKADSDYPFALRHESDAFARFDATQSYAMETLLKILNGEEIDPAFIESYGYLLALDVDLSYKALLLSLPTVSTIVQTQEVIDFDAIHQAKKRLVLALATAHEATLQSLYHALHFPKAGSSAEEIAQRSLKNRCLSLLCVLDTEPHIALAQAQYHDSLSMSDRMTALSIIENAQKHHSDDALEDFYARYHEDHLVMTKYLSLQASSSREGLLDRVKALQKRDLYDQTVPNSVRALIGAFTANSKYFHANDGSGYQFLAEQLIAIDPINAQMASRLAGAFKLYKKMNPHSQGLMGEALKQVIESKDISKNVYEIVSKILKG